MHASRILLLASITLSASLASVAPAGPPKEEHFDIWLRPVDGRIVTGAITEGTPGTPLSDAQRVFGAELGEDPLFPYSAFEPGVQALPDSSTAGMTWSFNIVHSLRTWNGSGFDPADESMLIEFGPAGVSTGGGFVPGFSFTGFADGLLHDHFDFTLEAGAPLAGAEPDPGIYLLTLEFLGVNGAANYAASDPTFLVFNLEQSEEDHEAAMQWVEANLVPGPGGMALLLAGCSNARRRRRPRVVQRP